MSAAPEPEDGNPENLEVVPGFEHEQLQGRAFEASTETEFVDALEKAFDYRGDVTIQLKDGTSVEGYIFDRRMGSTLADSSVRLFPRGDARKVTVNCADITGLAFSGRDTAAGKSWEAWVRKYWEKKAAGETQIELKPEHLE